MKKTNLLFPLTLSLLVSALTVSCSTKKTAGNLSKIKAEGAVTIAMEGAWQPWTYHNENNEIRYCSECERYICADCMDFHGDICEECFDEKNAEREEA